MKFAGGDQRMMSTPRDHGPGSGWIDGNRLELLENGETYYPAVFAAIEAAQHEVLVETFILFEDKVGLALHRVLVEAARRGVRVDLTVDGFGSPALSAGYVKDLTEAGVRVHVFDPPPKLSRQLRLFRRFHRKIVVVDGTVGFVGGINFSADHLGDFGPEAKQDYAVRLEGPAVAALRREALKIVTTATGWRWWRKRPEQLRLPTMPQPCGTAAVQVVIRDNQRHRDDIERHYRRALQAAQREVIIANAYFFPGYRLLKSLQRAARRGVKVHLIMQGQPDLPWAAFFARMVYGLLTDAGVCVHEYCERPLHGKVALVDGEWATVGSSNLDPLSLALNLEANLMVRDRSFNAVLRERLQHLIDHQCSQVCGEQTHNRRWWWRLGLGALAFHVMRKFPRWAAALPAHRPELVPVAQTAVLVDRPASEPAEPWDWQQREAA